MEQSLCQRSAVLELLHANQTVLRVRTGGSQLNSRSEKPEVISHVEACIRVGLEVWRRLSNYRAQEGNAQGERHPVHSHHLEQYLRHGWNVAQRSVYDGKCGEQQKRHLLYA